MVFALGAEGAFGVESTLGVEWAMGVKWAMGVEWTLEMLRGLLGQFRFDRRKCPG